MTGVTPRTVAIDVLLQAEEGAYANVALPALLRRTSLSPTERAFVTDLAYGTLRRRAAIDHLLTRIVDKPLNSLDPPVRAALRLGAYQLVEGVPAHAAVGETVSAVKRRAKSARGYVNAVLRRLSELGPDWPWPTGDDVASIAVRSSHPEWIVRQLLEDLGPRDAYAVLDIDNLPAEVTLRVDRGSPEALADELRAAGANVTRGGLVPEALIVRGAGDLARLPAVVEGRATPQDQASQAVVDILAPRAGERVLDVGAGPGGKTGAIAARASTVVAVEVDAGRLRLVRAAAARLQHTNVVTLLADARRPPLRAGSFDRVLVDAPCSGLGVLRRRPDARWRPRSIAALAQLQRELLRAAAPLVRPGGVLVYAVCTLTWEETREVDAWATAELSQLTARPAPGPPWRPWGRGGLLLPHVAGTDGMYVLVLQRGG